MDNILNLIKAIEKVAGKSPCKKTVQKITYLVQEAKEDLGYDYSIHFYGPYSAELDSEIRYLNNCGKLNIKITDRGHMLSVDDDSDVTFSNNNVRDIITYFGTKSPSDLELLATTLYVQREIQNSNIQNIVDGVEKIKGSKYSNAQINNAIDELVNYKYFSN